MSDSNEWFSMKNVFYSVRHLFNQGVKYHMADSVKKKVKQAENK